MLTTTAGVAGSGNARTIVDQLDQQLVTLLTDLDKQDYLPADLRLKIANSSRAMSSLLAGGPQTGPATPPPAAETPPDDEPFTF